MTTLMGLDLEGRLVLVAGGGPVAARRTAAVLHDGALVRLVAPQVCEDLAELAMEGTITWLAREVRQSDVDGVWLVHTATGDRSVDRDVAAWAAARHVWCVNASASEGASARTPAVTRHGEIIVGVVSGGTAADPSRSAAVRDNIAEHLRSGGADLRRRRPPEPGTTGRVTLVGGGPGATDLLTVRGRRALAEADVVVTDRLGPTGVLAELGADVEIIDVGKTPGHHPVPQAEINQLLVEHAQRGLAVVRLKGGDPYVLGRGGEEVLACREAGVAVEVVPGISSALAVPAMAGIPVTHRGTATAVHVITGHDGLTPAAAQAVLDPAATLVILMGVACLPAIAEQALEAGANPATPVAIIEDGTLPTQRVTRTQLARAATDAHRAGVRAPAVIVIGEVAALDLISGQVPGGASPADGDGP